MNDVGKNLQEAVKWATRLHFDQFRDGKPAIPYICHPIDVLTKARYIGKITDENILIACVLHDVIEECNTSPAKIKQRFGDSVCRLVTEVTRNEPTELERSGLSSKQIWQLRTARLFDEIKVMSDNAKIIKLADRLSNVEEAKCTRVGHKLDRYFRQTKEILRLIHPKINPHLHSAISLHVNE